ncbi:MAG: dienelactone hydrolase family protein [Gammaproteobacteria bacterium]
MPHLPCVEIEPAGDARAAVIWLHGLGANGHDFEPVVPELRLPGELAVRFVFPHAPAIPVTINNGFVMPAWYDITEMSIGHKVDEEGLLRSAGAVKALLDRERERGIDSRRIVLAGFSQGGAVGYQAALTYPSPLAGLLVLSAYFATVGSIRIDPANAGLPIRIYHGTADPIVPEALGRESRDALIDMGYRPEYKTYPMQHAVCPEEIADISAALREWLSQ